MSCSPQRFFYYPNRVLYHDPARMGVAHDVVEYPSVNGKKLFALFFPAQGRAKGTVVHFHGNFGNFSNHFPLILFLPPRGFNVLSFDYQGYGASEGNPTPKNMVEDGQASIRYAVQRSSGASVFILGQSLGGAVATVVAAREKEVKAVVLEAAFTRFRSIGRTAAARHVLTWPLMVAVPFLSRRYDPIDVVDEIAPRPVFFIHGEADKIVPASMSRELFKEAKDPKKLWLVPGAGHLEIRRRVGTSYEDEVVRFFETAAGT
jgi:fermentation-respiration switch protein FrsA (DUF1100 family)